MPRGSVLDSNRPLDQTLLVVEPRASVLLSRSPVLGSKLERPPFRSVVSGPK